MIADRAVWSVTFTTIGVVILANLPNGIEGRFFLIGAASIVVGAGFALGTLMGWLRGR
jgi:hypothetical protein